MTTSGAPSHTVELETNHFQASWSSAEALNGQRQSGTGKQRKYTDCSGTQQDLLRQKEMARLHGQAFGLSVTRYKVEMCMGMGFPMGPGIPWEWE